MPGARGRRVVKLENLVIELAPDHGKRLSARLHRDSCAEAADRFVALLNEGTDYVPRIFRRFAPAMRKWSTSAASVGHLVNK